MARETTCTGEPASPARRLRLAAARGTAFFLGAYLLASAFANAALHRVGQDIWLVDTGFLTPPLGALLALTSAVVLVAYAVAPRLSDRRRAVTVAACGALAVVALQNVSAFYRAWGAGGFHPFVPFPFSLVITAGLGLLGWAAWTTTPVNELTVADHAMAAVGFMTVMLCFPLAQVGFFGTSDYRAPADAVVVFGARVYPDGSLTTSLADRVNTAVDLYRSGLVRTIVMSGGIGTSGVDEAMAMRAASVRAGVPASAVLLDSAGIDTEATVANTAEMFGRRGIRRVLVVSQGYHLPRIKLAYRAAGLEVRTVPAGTSTYIVQTPLFIAREVPAFWKYWALAMVFG